ncbi:MAG TPA: cupredoxin domain-containing protein [Actinomycetota bacterium]
MATQTNPERDPLFRALIVTMAMAIVVVLAFDAISHQTAAAPAKSRQIRLTTGTATAPVTYRPQTRSLVVTAVPLLVHEQAGFFDYLKKDFGKGGLLQDKEVWGFSPNTLTVYGGDTVNVTVINPGDDPHTFTIPEVNFSLSVEGKSQVEGSFVVPSAGLYKFFCAIPEHTPYMWGNLIVLPDSAAS